MDEVGQYRGAPRRREEVFGDVGSDESRWPTIALRQYANKLLRRFQRDFDLLSSFSWSNTRAPNELS